VAFAVLLHPKAEKEVEKIEHQTRTRITERLKELKNNPEAIGKVLKHSDFWSLRIGDYSTIYEIDRAKKQVIILFVGHKKKVYDDFSKLL
jgi:mRNA-degrading endonuclease RelE of RelBE toxin-antitoxin system